MHALLLGGEPGTDPILGGFDADGRLHEISSSTTDAEGVAVVALGNVIDLDGNDFSALYEPNRPAPAATRMAPPLGHTALAS